MKRIPFFLTAAALITSCQSSNSVEDVISQTFVHKYGFETTKEDWSAREKDGKVVTTLKNGVKVTSSYENGKLHGPTTHTFANSSVIEKQMVYDQGTLLKEMINDQNGMPISEKVYESDHQMIVTLWDEKGVPLSIEEYDGEFLVDGKYFTPEHDLEADVEAGVGERVKRDRTGLLVSSDRIQDGVIAARTTYHPNGNKHTISHYQDYQLHGEQLKFTASGRPLMELSWDRGVLDGVKTVYRNGIKVAVIPYVKGQRQGTEFHYDDLGNLTAEIEWRDDKKHGSSRLHSEESTETEWFFNGQTVNAEKFQILNTREQITTEFNENVAR